MRKTHSGSGDPENQGQELMSEDVVSIDDSSRSPSSSKPVSRVMSPLKSALGALVLVALLFFNLHTRPYFQILPLSSQDPCHSSHKSDKDGEPTLGAVASETTVCSQIGIDVIKFGGNAADAMIATTFCVGVIGMYHSGIGGGGFALVRAPDGSFEHIDFRESAPAAAFEDMYENNTAASVSGGLASGVPGEVRGLQHIHEKYGSLPWDTLLQPAIRLARDGFPVSFDLDRAMGSDGTRDFLSQDPTWAIDFAPNGTRLGLGDILTRKRYAATLQTIAERGPDAFYNGPIAETMVDAVQRANGTMTLEDLRNYRVEIRNVSHIDYRGYKIYSTGTPSSGSVVLNVMKIVEGYDDFLAPENLNLSTHRLTEAMRFAYGKRTSFGDPSFLRGMQAYEENMLKDATVHDIRKRISDYHTQNVSAYDPDGIEVRDTPGTSHVTTADHSGLAISLTTTVNLYFGSQVMVPETGIIMNNEMDDFSIPGASNAFGYVPSPSNYIRPGKRPMSSITPTIVTHPDGRLYFVTGAAGGSRIITATIQSLMNVLDRGMTSHESLAEPRLHDQLIPNLLFVEKTYDSKTLAFLEGRGHNISWFPSTASSAVQAVRLLPNGTFEAAGEPRQTNSGGLAI